MSSGASSLATAFEQIAPAPGIMGAEASAEQLDLLRGEDGRLPDNVFQLAREAERKAGRPKGAVNKRSSDLAKLLASKFPDPVQFQASIYAMPLDQLCEALLVADGTIARQRAVDALLEDLGDRVGELAKAAKGKGASADAIERLAEACEALEGAARRSQGKPGDVALKALNLQLAAARTVSEYWHSKKPVEAVVTHRADAVLVMPSAQPAAGFDAVDETTRMAGQLLAQALAKGTLTGDQIAGLQLVDGRLMDAEFEEIESGESDGGE